MRKLLTKTAGEEVQKGDWQDAIGGAKRKEKRPLAADLSWLPAAAAAEGEAAKADTVDTVDTAAITFTSNHQSLISGLSSCYADLVSLFDDRLKRALCISCPPSAWAPPGSSTFPLSGCPTKRGAARCS